MQAKQPPKSQPAFPYKRYLGPRYWPTWLGLGLLRVLCYLPLPLLRGIGNILGTLSYYSLPQQRRITQVNIGLCFPALTNKQQHALARACLRSVAIGLFESALSWWGDEQRLRKLHHVEGLEHLQAAREKNKGVLLLGGHYTTLEISGRFLELHTTDIHPTYKPAHNKLFEAVMSHSRKKLFDDLLPSRDMRKIVRTLKQNKIVWYAPDQDFGREGTVFAPFMGVPTATLTITARLAQLTGAPVIPFASRRLPGNQGYVISLKPALKDFPSDNEVANASRINRAIEENLKQAPEQYLWVHRRFKTRPYGEPQLYPLRRDKRLKRYSRTLALLTIPAVLYTLWTAVRIGGNKYLLERLGLGQSQAQNQTTQKRIWIHAASVGEVNAVLPLVKLIAKHNPDLAIYFTTATPTGQANAVNKMPDNVECHYLPIDWWYAVKHFLHTVQPTCALIVETEIWPNLYEACFQAGVPLIIINGRLSARTLNARAWLHSLYCKCMENVFAVLARSEEDAQGFRRLTLPEERLKVIGNIKFASAERVATAPIKLGRPYVLAASTRESEEARIVKQWLNHVDNNTLLVIAPRHPKRLKNILRDLTPLCKDIAVRSREESITAKTRIYIADTFGELPAFIAGSQFVIMGGAFAPKGGQNIIEAAQQGKAVVFGPNMANFRDEARQFVQHQAGIQVENDEQLGDAISELLADKTKADELGDNGRKLIDQQSDMAQRYLQELIHLCPDILNNTMP